MSENIYFTEQLPVYAMRGCTEAVTVWNRYRCPDTGIDRFYKHVLPVLCKWELSLKRGEYRSNMGSAGVSASLLIIVPFSEDYRPYRIWNELDDDGRRRFFTFNLTDLIAKGAYYGDDEFVITGEPPHTECDLKRRLGADTANITGFADNTARRFGRHYKVGCFYGLKSGF